MTLFDVAQENAMPLHDGMSRRLEVLSRRLDR